MKNKLILLLSLTAIALILAGCFLFPTALEKPRLISPSNGQQNVATTVTLKWADPNNSIDTYRLYFGNEENPSLFTVSTRTEVTVNNLKYSTTYYWKVVVSDGVACATSETWKFTTQNPPYPTPPTLKITAKSTDSISLAWTQSKNASELNLYEDSGNGFSEIESFTPTVTSYKVSGLNPSTEYSFYLIAVNPYGSATSNTVSTMTNALPKVETSSLSVYLTDKPLSPSDASAVYVAISAISIHSTEDGTSTWHEMLKNPRSCDLMQLVGNATSIARISLHSSASIDEIDVRISSATVVVNGKSYKAKMQKNEIKLSLTPFKVSDSTSLYLDFDLSTSMQCMGPGMYEFSPSIRAICGKSRAELSGKVTLGGIGVKNAVLSLCTNDATISQTFSKMGGYFRFAAVPAGNYVLKVQAIGASDYSTNVSLKVGENDIGTIELSPSLPSFSVYLTDDPISPANASAVYVTIANITLKTASNGKMEWYSVLSTPVKYNVLDLMGTSVSIASSPLPASAVMNQLKVEISSATVVVGTQTFAVKISNKTLTINLEPLKISAAKSLFLDFDLSDSIIYHHGTYMLIPHMHAICGMHRATLQGKVLLYSKPVKDALVSLSDSSTVVAKTYTKHDGKFRFAAIKSGNYTLNITAVGALPYSTSVSVHLGNNNVGNIELGTSSSGTAPASPVITSLKANSGKITLKWTEKSTDVTNFEIFKKSPSASSYALVFTLPATIFQYEEVVSIPGTYCYEVAAKNAYGISRSEPKSVNVQPLP